MNRQQIGTRTHTVATALTFAACAGTAHASLVLNEIYYDPSGSNQFDHSGNGSISGATDEFIEIVNNSASPLDISGYKVGDSTDRFEFPVGTVVQAGHAVLLFGGPQTPADSSHFGGALVFADDQGGWISNGGDTINIKNASDVVVDQYTYAGGEADAVSLTRSPDIAGAWTSHPDLGAVAASPGFHIDGVTPFVPEPSTAALFAFAGMAMWQRRRNG